MELYDTHAHLADEHLSADVAGVIERARLASVTRILAVGTTADSSTSCQQIAASFPSAVRSSAGIHPNHAEEAQPGDWERIEVLAKTGLDLYWKDCPLPLQQDYFDRHIRLSQQTGLALVIHQR